jgi:2'-5' RNA ligase
MRHITLAFLGNTDHEKVLQNAQELPQNLHMPAFAPVGVFSHCHFFPKKHPRCVSWGASWKSHFDMFQNAIIAHFVDHKLIEPLKRPFIPHATVARSPFDKNAFKESFSPVAFYAPALHLYQSLGHSKYTSLWHVPWKVPFVEIEHTADLAFQVYARNLQELSLHAQAALCFAFAECIPFSFTLFEPENLDHIVYHLNKIIALCDSECGSPVKAVSYHDTVLTDGSELIWEMIIDV